jgi:trimethylamine--corrinoid protein Co-methyltransferase
MRPRLTMLEPSLMERIIEEAYAILGSKGVLVDHPPAFDRLVALGLEEDGVTGRLRIRSSLIDEALESSPSSIALYDRAGELHTRLEGDRIHFVPASSALRVLDRSTGEIREPTTPDFVEYVKVADSLPNIAYLSTAFNPGDIPQEMADAWRLYIALSYSKQPVVSGAFTAWGVDRMGRIMELFRRDRDELVSRPMSIFTCCPNTPLRWGEDAVSNLIDCADWGIPVEIVPVLLLGMISPVTPVGALVLHTAEVLSGLVIAQLVRPGTPVIFGGAPAAFHMRLMTNPMSAVEALRVDCSYAEIARHLGLPSQAYMGLSDSRFNDSQAGAESGVGMFLAALAGINSISGPGMLDFVNCFSLEKLVFDDELAAHAHRYIRPVEVIEDLPTGSLIDQLLEENHLLTADHTLEHWPEELYLPGPMVDRKNLDQWEMAGEKRFEENAAEIIDEALDEYDEEPLEEPLHEEIRRLFLSTCPEEGLILPNLS